MKLVVRMKQNKIGEFTGIKHFKQGGGLQNWRSQSRTNYVLGFIRGYFSWLNISFYFLKFEYFALKSEQIEGLSNFVMRFIHRVIPFCFLNPQKENVGLNRQVYMLLALFCLMVYKLLNFNSLGLNFYFLCKNVFKINLYS